MQIGQNMQVEARDNLSRIVVHDPNARVVIEIDRAQAVALVDYLIGQHKMEVDAHFEK